MAGSIRLPRSEIGVEQERQRQSAAQRDQARFRRGTPSLANTELLRLHKEGQLVSVGEAGEAVAVDERQNIKEKLVGVTIDLQAIFDRCYDAGPYAREVNYGTDAVIPPLEPDRAAWAARARARSVVGISSATIGRMSSGSRIEIQPTPNPSARAASHSVWIAATTE